MREIRVGFSLSDSHFLRRGNHVIDFFGDKMPWGKWLAAHFLLAPSCCGVVDARVCLLRELRRARLVRIADRWVRPPLSARVAPIAGGG
jgi:hypothetical protein